MNILFRQYELKGALLFGALLSSAFTASAFPIAAPGSEGNAVQASGHVIATYEGNSAAYSNDLYLEWNGTGPGLDGNLLNDIFIFNNHASSVGATVDLGTFAPGTELVFRLHVQNTGNNFYSGDPSRNPDSHAHARVEGDFLVPGTTLVSFEDLLNGPFDYNDLSFSFTGTRSVPQSAPDGGATLGMFGVAGLFLGVARKKLSKS